MYNMSKLTFSEALAALKEINHLSAIDEALTFFENHYKNIPIDAALEDIDMSRRKYYLDLHQSLGHVITYNDKDGRYRTYVYHKDGSSQLIARSTKKAVEDKVIEHYETVELLITVDKIKDDYFQERQKFVKQSTIAREKGIYNSFFKGNLITTMAFSRIKTKDVEEFMDTTLREKKLSKKAFNNLKSLVNGIFDYAVANEYAERNVAREIRSFGRSYFNDKGRYDDREMYYEHQTGFSDDMLGDEDDDTSFSDDIVDETDDDITQYFPPADQNKLIETAMQIFRNSLNTAYLAIILTFCLGLRIGELVGSEGERFRF